MFDISIIGGGIAGLTASIYAARAGKSVALFEEKCVGGQILNANNIENYPGISSISGIDLINNIKEKAILLGVKIITEKVNNIDKSNIFTYNNTYKTKTIIIATGLRKRPLGLYLEQDFVGKGISYCATCDGNFYRSKDVSIVGGGNTAIEDALYLSGIVNKLYVIHRKDNFRADDILVKKLNKASNVEFLMNSEIIRLEGNDTLEQITVKNKMGEKNLNISGLFIAIGQIPDNLRFSNLLELDENGFIISNDCTTKIPNIFVAGDCRTKKLRQLVTAASDGAVSASLAIEYLSNLE